MKIELSSEEAQNLVVFINAYGATGQAQEVAVMLKLKLNKAIQDKAKTVQAEPPFHDGVREEVPAES